MVGLTPVNIELVQKFLSVQKTNSFRLLQSRKQTGIHSVCVCVFEDVCKREREKKVNVKGFLKGASHLVHLEYEENENLKS